MKSQVGGILLIVWERVIGSNDNVLSYHNPGLYLNCANFFFLLPIGSGQLLLYWIPSDGLRCHSFVHNPETEAVFTLGTFEDYHVATLTYLVALLILLSPGPLLGFTRCQRNYSL